MNAAKTGRRATASRSASEPNSQKTSASTVRKMVMANPIPRWNSQNVRVAPIN